MRGDKEEAIPGALDKMGSPPHARGEGHEVKYMVWRDGITPACAGIRTWSGYCSKKDRDHPRMRGDKLLKLQITIPCTGSPPHARG